MNKLFKYIRSLFAYEPNSEHTFTFPQDKNNESETETASDSEKKENTKDSQENISTNLSKNLNYLKKTYNSKLSSDIMIRDFYILTNNIRYKAFIIYIDGMVDSVTINTSVLSPLMVRNRANSFDEKNAQFETQNKPLNEFVFEESGNLEDFIYNTLIPQNAIEKVKSFSEIFTSINMGNCILFVETLGIAFDLDVKGFKQRSIDTPSNEIVIRGSQECFVENIRTNTSILRRLINNEKLVLESMRLGKLTKTNIAIGYIEGVTNKKLVQEIRYRLENLDIDYLTSSGQLEQLIQDHPKSIFPQTIATERPDKVVNHLLDGRVCIIVNGSPYVIVLPGVFVDYLSSPEDYNLKYQYANLEKIIRLVSIFLAVLLPGIYIAVTNYHQDLLPTELLFTISASRESVPFPTVVEIMLMEISFELIREAGVRVPSALGTTIGIVGALILGEAAVSASLVSPILIIIVAITGICSFSIPDLSLNYTFRICRFAYILLGFMAGFLGIGVGLFIQLAIMCHLRSFGAPYLDPSSIHKRSISNYFVLPVWKREQLSKFVHPKKAFSQGKISMKWRDE